MRTLDEYAATRAQRPNQIDHRAELVRGLRMMAQESVRAEALTGDPAWDGFLAYLEAFIAAAKRSLESELAKVRDPLTGEEEVRRSRALVARLDTRIATLEQIIGFPALLKHDAERAAKMLEAVLAESALADENPQRVESA